MAKGKSLEMQSTTVLLSAVALLLNSRTAAAHVPVSTLGKILRTMFFPEKVFELTSLRSTPVNVKSGAVLPTDGRLDDVFAKFSLCHIFSLFKELSNSFRVPHEFFVLANKPVCNHIANHSDRWQI